MMKVTFTSRFRLQNPPKGFPFGRDVVEAGTTATLEKRVADEINGMGVPMTIHEETPDNPIVPPDLTVLEQRVLELLKERKKLSQAACANQLDEPVEVVKPALHRLVEFGMLNNTGERVQNSPVFEIADSDIGQRPGDI